MENLSPTTRNIRLHGVFKDCGCIESCENMTWAQWYVWEHQ